MYGWRIGHAAAHLFRLTKTVHQICNGKQVQRTQRLQPQSHTNVIHTLKLPRRKEAPKKVMNQNDHWHHTEARQRQYTNVCGTTHVANLLEKGRHDCREWKTRSMLDRNVCVRAVGCERQHKATAATVHYISHNHKKELELDRSSSQSFCRTLSTCPPSARLASHE